MALETLKGIQRIGGFKVIVMDGLRDEYPDKFNESGAMDWQWFEKDIRPYSFIYVRHDKNSLSFTLQNGPVRQVGTNGCQVDTIIEAAKMIIEGLNKNFPCVENGGAITCLNSALEWLEFRKKNRETRGVEGLNLP